jgi:hypothetical protein
MSWLLKIRKVLTIVTDLLLKGRQAGLWNEKPTIPNGGISKEGPDGRR